MRFGDETATSLVDREGVVITCVGDFEETTNSKVDEGDGNKVAMLKDFKGRLEVEAKGWSGTGGGDGGEKWQSVEWWGKGGGIFER